MTDTSGTKDDTTEHATAAERVTLALALFLFESEVNAVYGRLDRESVQVTRYIDKITELCGITREYAGFTRTALELRHG